MLEQMNDAAELGDIDRAQKLVPVATRAQRRRVFEAFFGPVATHLQPFFMIFHDFSSFFLSFPGRQRLENGAPPQS